MREQTKSSRARKITHKDFEKNTVNEIRATFGLSPIDGGDITFIKKDESCNVKSSN